MNHLFQEHPLGHVYEDAEVTVFFGNKLSTEAAVAQAFPDFELMILNQTHSDLIVPAPFSAKPEADAQFTRRARVALCIRTADCTPVMIFDPSSRLIGAAHAGWRGVENEIVRKLCARLAREGANLDHARAWIGPHIGAASFEVGLNVAARLQARFEAVRGFSPEATALLPHEDPTKARLNLLAIVRAQLNAADIEKESVLELPIDTLTSLAHESFRRDATSAGRQISFIALK
jgi:YfiH family protein